jgi:hypothetical protein
MRCPECNKYLPDRCTCNGPSIEEQRNAEAMKNSDATTPASSAMTFDLSIGVAVGMDHEGATIVIQQRLKDGKIAVIYSGTHPKGDSAGRAALQQRQAPAMQVGRAALMEFIDKVCFGKSELISCAESAFYWFNKCLAKSEAAPAPTAEPDMLRDMLAIQEACGLHTDEYAPGSVIEYIKELEGGQAEAAAPVATDENAEHLRRQRENAEFTEWWVSSGQQAAHDLTTENAAHATWQERARRAASPAAHPVSTGAGELSKRLRAIAASVAGNNPALIYPKCLIDAADALDRAAHPSAEGAKPLTITLQRGTNQQEISRLGWLQARVHPVPTYRDNAVLPTYKLKPIYYTVSDEAKAKWDSYPLMSVEELLSRTSGE